MTKEEKLKILSEALNRAVRDLDASEHLLGKDTYYLVRTIGDLDLLLRREDSWSPDPTCNPEPHDTAPVETHATEAQAEANEPEPEPGLTKAEMVTRLSELGDACPGDNVIPSVMKSMGYEKLSLVPASQYAKLLEKAEAAVKAAKEAK